MTTIAAALNDVINARHMTVDDAITKHFTEEYRQCTDGSWSDRSGFAEHIDHLRSVVERVEVRVLNEVMAGRAYADRHHAHILKTDGATVVQEVYLFGELAEDGRFSVVHEVTQMLHGNESDREIGTARGSGTPA